jgi:hypothetical protein
MRIAFLAAAALIAILAYAGSADAGKPTPAPQYEDRVWGDILCNGMVDAGDALPILQWAAGTGVGFPGLDCPSIIVGLGVQGDSASPYFWGNVDCSSEATVDQRIRITDALAILRAAIGEPLSPADGCLTLGQTYSMAILGK